MSIEPNCTIDAIEILYRRYYEGKCKRTAELEAERANAKVARKVYQLRSDAGMTQKDLARIVGTTPTVIGRLEEADYEGHALSMLRRVVAALEEQAENQAAPAKKKPRESGLDSLKKLSR